MRYTMCKFAFVGCLLWWQAVSLSADDCVKRPFGEVRPQWISSVAFDPAENRLLIADPKGAKVLSYYPKEDALKILRIDFPGASVTRVDNGMFLQFYENDNERAEVISPIAGLSRKISLQEAKKGASPQLGSLYSSWIAQGSNFVGFGSLYLAPKDISRSEAGGFQTGFIRGTLDVNTGKFENLEFLEATNNNSFYLLGLPYFAATNKGLFYVRMGVDERDRASIVKVLPRGAQSAAGAKVEKVAAFPAGYERVPDIKSTKANSPSDRFGLLEESKMAAGLFGKGEFLYLLTREPDPEGQGTRWLLHKIDPEKSQILGAVRLPTNTNHVSIAVGPQTWYVIERGEVRGLVEQDIKSIIQIPDSWISSPASSKLRADRPTIKQCKIRGLQAP